ncbi:MBL fold metallo-hydrolase [Mangrovibacterium lignilyticum]|uniref:MBL fold metallo-hydrolase n=1 Tax=Mangrovibacterium lignilyticum TaxID=2668052 RepID=UPI0021D080E3|nr:MBL fold metallo-hydrolase [Mangrovibacterium lignilyticum]
MIVFLIISLSCGNRKNDWYRISKIDSKTFIISEPKSSQNNSCFLIMGSKEAILLDSGTGENKDETFKNIISALTDLPLTVLLSHFHFDHIGTTSEFDCIGIPEIPVIEDKMTVDSLLHLTNTETLAQKTATLKISKLFPVGKDIDLGNRKIKILYTPGHSKESISLIDNENGYLFTGDLVYNGLLLINDCDAYVRSINEIIKNSNSKYKVFGAHGRPEISYERLFKIEEAIENYRSGRDTINPFRQVNFFGTTKSIYKIGDVTFMDGYTDAFNND